MNPNNFTVLIPARSVNRRGQNYSHPAVLFITEIAFHRFSIEVGY